jgi:type IV secretory pathway VirB4 component
MLEIIKRKEEIPMVIRKSTPSAHQEDPVIKEFIDMIAPSVIKFNTDHFICGSTFRCVWVLQEYPTATEEQALLRHLGEKDSVTLRIYARQVTAAEEKKIIANAANRNRLQRSNTNDLQQTVVAENNLQDVAALVSTMHRNREPLLHCAVYLELSASDYDRLKLLQTEVLTELVRSKLNVDRLILRQQQGFLSAMPAGWNAFGPQFERVLPASSVANLYPFNYSGKTDAKGFYLGRDKFGSNILVDFDQRDDDKTNSCILILGNSGQGKSYLLKLILTNMLESGLKVIALDPEMEYEDLTNNMGGCFIDLMSGEFIINVLEPKSWGDARESNDTDTPEAFRKTTKLSQHVSFLKDFFRSYKDFSDSQIDVIEIMLGRLYEQWDIHDNTDFGQLQPTDYPILSDLYDFIEQEYQTFQENNRELYTAKQLQEILLGLHSICRGAESKFFNGNTNITSHRFLTFGVKGLLQASQNLRNAMLFNILSYMTDKLLTEGSTAASIDELYLFLTNLIAIEYIRNAMKRVRKKNSSVILASQNLEDFNIDGIRELTKPLFSIPTHVFLFNAGNVDSKFYIDSLQLEECEYNLIKFPQRGCCLYKCGNERYNLIVHAPEYKEKLFGKAGGR